MGGCIRCDMGKPHKRRHCNDPVNTKFCALCAANRVHFDCPNEEEVPVYEVSNTVRYPDAIKRIDRHTLSIHGVWIPANEDQERRIRALTPSQIGDLLTLMGRGSGPRIQHTEEGAPKELDDLNDLM